MGLTTSATQDGPPAPAPFPSHPEQRVMVVLILPAFSSFTCPLFAAARSDNTAQENAEGDEEATRLIQANSFVVKEVDEVRDFIA